MLTDQLIIQKIEAALTTVRPWLQRDGGDVELVKVENDIVYVRLHGACVTCPISQLTLKMGIEESIKADVPTIKEVISVT